MATWIRRVQKGHPSRSRPVIDELTAQLHRAEQNLAVEAAARARADSLAQEYQASAAAAQKWAASLDEESAKMHQKHVAIAHDLAAAQRELERLKAERRDAMLGSPTPSEQLAKEAQSVKISWQQSQDLVRAMASTAAAAEARSKQLQDQLAQAQREVVAGKEEIAGLRSMVENQAQELLEATRRLSDLGAELESFSGHPERRVSDSPLRRLQAKDRSQAAKIRALENRLKLHGLPQLEEDLGQLVRALSEGDKELLEDQFKAGDARQKKPLLSVSLPSPRRRNFMNLPSLDSLCNQGSPNIPAGLLKPVGAAKPASPLLEAYEVSEEEEPELDAAAFSRTARQAVPPKQEGAPLAQQRVAFQLAPEQAQSVSKMVFTERGKAEQAAKEIEEQPALPAIAASKDVVAEKETGDPFQRGFFTAEELTASDFAPLGRNQAQLQEVHTGLRARSVAAVQAMSAGPETMERPPLSPANRETTRRVEMKSPLKKLSPFRPAPSQTLKPKRVDAVDGGRRLPVYAFTPNAENEEEQGPLGMGSRVVDELTTPQKGKAPHAVHKGLLKLAHRVSPMRIKRPSPYNSPREGF